MYDYDVEIVESDGSTTTLAGTPVEVVEVQTGSAEIVEVVVEGPQGPGNVVVVPTGTTGWDTQPDGTLWVEYTP